MKAWDDSMTVAGTVHDRKFTAVTFSFSYLYLLSFCVHRHCLVMHITVI